MFCYVVGNECKFLNNKEKEARNLPQISASKVFSY